MKKILFFLTSASLFSSGTAYSKEYKFNTKYLTNTGESVFNYDLLSSGNYVVDVYVNDKLQGVEEIYFKKVKDKITPCITRENLIAYGIKSKELVRFKFDREQCLYFNEFISFNYDTGSQILKIEVDKILLADSRNDIEEPSLWDDGITAFMLNYRVDYLHNYKKSREMYNGQFEPGMNYGPWRLRNLSSWSKGYNRNAFHSTYSYLERVIPSIKSKVSIGERYTNSDTFESIPFRGLSLSSDENMTPYAKRSYTPVIAGIAKTQAQVEIRQNGFLLYTTSVAPGAFEIKDSSLSSVNGGELEVKVIESNGEVQNFTVPFSKPFYSVAEGYFRYNFNVGRYRSYHSDLDRPYFLDMDGAYGLPLGWSTLGGFQITKNYNSFSLGTSKDFGEIGAFSSKWKISKSFSKIDKESRYGNAIDFNYNKSLSQTSTAINIGAYRSFSRKYKSLSEEFENSTKYNYFFKGVKKRNISIGINQGFEMYGYLYFGYNHDVYWDSATRNSISMKYSIPIKSSMISLSYTKSRILNNNFGRDEGIFSFWVTIPLGSRINPSYASYQYSSSGGNNATHEAGISGSEFERRLNWDVRQQIGTGNTKSSRGYLSSSWNGTYGQVGLNYTNGTQTSEIGGNLSGGMVIHDKGITFGQRLADTTALIEARNVPGVKVLSAPGTYTDFRGYTIAGGLSPYKTNVLSIAPESIPEGHDIRQTDVSVIPTEGAIVKAKFITRSGYNALIRITKKGGGTLPLGSIIYMKDDKNTIQSTFIVNDKGQFYATGLKENGKLYAVSGSGSVGKCQINYNLKNKKPDSGIFVLNEECE